MTVTQEYCTLFGRSATKEEQKLPGNQRSYHSFQMISFFSQQQENEEISD